MKNKKTGILTGIIIIISLINFVSAFAVSSGYYKDNPLKLSAGESRDVQLVLQNMAGGENITARASVSSGSDIIKLSDASNIYFVPVGGRTGVNFKVTIPGNAKIGSIYSVEIMFVTVADPKSGTFGFGSGIEQKFDIVIVQSAEELEKAAEKPKGKISTQAWMLIIGIVVMIVIIMLIVLRGRKSGASKTTRR